VIFRVAALLLVIATMVLVREFAGGENRPTLALALGFAVIAALMMGEAAERLRMPRLTGYLIFGLLCGPYVLNLITAPMARELQFVNGLAIALIALIAGLELNISRLASRLRAISIIGATTLGVMYVGLGTLLWLAWPWLPIAPAAVGLERLSIVLVLTAIIVSFSPTVTIAVIAESRARGPLSELVLAVVVLADLALILVFTLVLQFARVAAGDVAEMGALMARLLWEIGGSLAFGALLGSLFAAYLRTVGRELTLALLALCVLLSIGGRAWHLEPLLAALAAGLVIENIARVRADALRDAVERSALPVLVVFFAAAGASLHLDALATIGLAALLVAVARIAVIRAGTHVGLRLAGVEDKSSQLLWMGLVSQAGVTLGLAIIVAAEFGGWGGAVQTLVVAMIALHELAGPILFKGALVRAGEVGALDRVPEAAPAPT
jgi:Kef-type K+ transport system membrane component KefB